MPLSLFCVTVGNVRGLHAKYPVQACLNCGVCVTWAGYSQGRTTDGSKPESALKLWDVGESNWSLTKTVSFSLRQSTVLGLLVEKKNVPLLIINPVSPRFLLDNCSVLLPRCMGRIQFCSSPLANATSGHLRENELTWLLWNPWVCGNYSSAFNWFLWKS